MEAMFDQATTLSRRDCEALLEEVESENLTLRATREALLAVPWVMTGSTKDTAIESHGIRDPSCLADRICENALLEHILVSRWPAEMKSLPVLAAE